jgi:hypothetical protein
MLRRAPITDQKSKLLGWALRSNRLGASTAASPCPRSPEGGGLSTRGEESASKLLPSGSPPVGIDLGELHSEQAYRGAVDCGDRAPAQSFAGWKDVGLSIIYVKTRTHSRKTSRSMERVRIPRVGGGVHCLAPASAASPTDPYDGTRMMPVDVLAEVVGLHLPEREHVWWPR